MRERTNFAFITALAFAASALLHAQWLNYPTKNVPRNADGSPNLAAPAPRTADGKIDFTGLWLLDRNRPCPKTGCDDMEISQEFINIGWSLKGGLPYQPWAAALVKERLAENDVGDPGAHCLPTGIVKTHTSPFYRRMVQTPDLIVLLTERDAIHRRIYMDGRPLPVDPPPTPDGYSTGRWERDGPGDTLVVETNGFPDGQWLDRIGSPLTSAAKITERFRRPDYGHMTIELTVDDPKAYTKPWTITLKQNIALNTEMLNFYCMENEKDSAHLTGK